MSTRSLARTRAISFPSAAELTRKSRSVRNAVTISRIAASSSTTSMCFSSIKRALGFPQTDGIHSHRWNVRPPSFVPLQRSGGMTLRPTNPFVAACRASPVARGRLSRAAVGAAVACLALLWSLALHGDAGRASPEPIAAISAPQDLDAAKVSLGAKLFGDPRLSESGKLACTSCHDLAGGGDDGLPRSRGSDARWLDFNAPTVFNAALNFRLNWRGNFRGFEAQNEAVLLDPRIMGSRWPVLLRRLERSRNTQRASKRLTDDPSVVRMCLMRSPASRDR